VAREVKRFESLPDYRGIVSDLGGPTANMYGMSCKRQARWKQGQQCRRRSCIYPVLCANFDASHERVRALLKAVRDLPGVRQAFVASGVRHDLALRDEAYVRDLARHHVGGHLKLAPEHADAHVLALMGKPPFEAFLEFVQLFQRLSRDAGREQYVVPYLMSSHPGCTPAHMRALADAFGSQRWTVEQVQDFYPTPMTISTAMYYTGRCPFSGQPVYVARTLREKAAQRTMLPTPRERTRRK
jgi:uncharacterized radical SAM protein YgiQ